MPAPIIIGSTAAAPVAPELQVITHNGLPPSQGGKRIAYRANGTVVSIGAYVPIDQMLAAHRAAAKRLSIVHAVVPQAPVLPDYDRFPVTDSSYGDCPICRRFIGSVDRHTQAISTNQGIKILCQCPKCDELFRLVSLWRS